MVDLSRQEKIVLLDEVFAPSRPVMTRDFFFGRILEINKALSAINEGGKHVILYGERGAGKTSLANFIKGYNQVLAVKINCDRHDKFDDIWRKTFRQISIPLTDGKWETEEISSSEKVAILERFLYEEKEIKSSSDILLVLQGIEIPILFIFDEFDLIEDQTTIVKFADTVKALSDNLPQITLFIVGIADSVNDLVGSHLSIERCTTQVKLPVMPDEELKEIIDKGLERIGLSIDDSVKNDIVTFSQGFPHYTHLLAKHSAKIAVYAESDRIFRQHFDVAINDAIDETYESVRESYRKAVSTVKKEANFKDIILACALVETDEYGTFRLADLQPVLSEIKQQPVKLQSYVYHISKLCEADRGSVLQQIGVKNKYRYKFRNPLVKAFVQLKNYQSNISSS